MVLCHLDSNGHKQRPVAPRLTEMKGITPSYQPPAPLVFSTSTLPYTVDMDQNRFLLRCVPGRFTSSPFAQMLPHTFGNSEHILGCNRGSKGVTAGLNL